ncbi:MAG: allophanate hydrolase subunit 1 [Micrococcales bacterium]|nr:allophanate hydrolase subunit 1 [Micrococcales bacterium]
MGDRAVLLEFATLEQTLAGYRGLEAAARPGVVDLIPAARTVLVVVDPRILSPRDAGVWARAAVPVPADAVEDREVVVPVRYDGEDLDAASTAAGLSPEGLVARHTATRWTSAFIGFSPGFAYLVAEGPGLGAEIPRRATSRPRVPAGSVGLAGSFTGVYPRESPGGWQLIGTTDAVLWDAAAQPPALLAPGTRVRFEAIR